MHTSPLGDSPSPPERDRQTGVSISLVIGVLAVALAVRVYYATGLPLTGDEADHLRIAREISLRDGLFSLPVHSPDTGQALGVTYVTALANWIGNGNVLVIRFVFIALSLVGLVGVYVLGATVFHPRVALVGLILAALDRHLVTIAPVFLESAIKWYREVVELVPNDGDAHLHLGILLTERNAIDEARRHVLAAGRLGVTIPPEICEKLSLIPMSDGPLPDSDTQQTAKETR